MTPGLYHHAASCLCGGCRDADGKQWPVLCSGILTTKPPTPKHLIVEVYDAKGRQVDSQRIVGVYGEPWKIGFNNGAFFNPKSEGILDFGDVYLPIPPKGRVEIALA